MATGICSACPVSSTNLSLSQGRPAHQHHVAPREAIPGLGFDAAVVSAFQGDEPGRLRVRYHSNDCQRQLGAICPQRLADPVRHGRVSELPQPFHPVSARDPMPQQRAGGDIRSHCFDDHS
ncbi:hypothetical protein S7711_10573 [Stachybotrys chartarum IBT 7711]|uniref:Uncharacterized protein n=1 Tax=Stachybotrys chartarum (strain CBS 109288 / IBT 7711) TaxID=1280523 RepID=A0A084AQF2_STACB|nr:hypothetical protein S7711_10573 [Stachybotrys chartarum IBT 7711]